MFIQFRTKNVLSFLDEVVFSMLAGKKTEFSEQLVIIQKRPVRKLLRSSIIYGINGGGKSNLLKAIALMDEIVSSERAVHKTHRDLVPFLLHTQSEGMPSLFEIIMRINGTTNYRYGFEIQGKHVTSEWLFETDLGKKENMIFIRDGQKIEDGSKQDWKKYGETLNENNQDNLILHIAKTLGSKEANMILKWFVSMRHIAGTDTDGDADFFKKHGWFEQNKQQVLDFLKATDFAIDDFRIGDPPSSQAMQEIENPRIREYMQTHLTPIHTSHKKYTTEGDFAEDIEFSLKSQESEGTQKIFDMAGPILYALASGHVLFVDELDVKLHPLVVKYILDLFNNPETNPNKAQLIFTTHNTYLLDKKFLRRDQIWFAQKDKYGASEVYSLAEFEEARKDTSYAKDYLLGRYGAIPII